MPRLNPFRDAGDRGVVANERLTGFAGALLLILALAEVLTVPGSAACSRRTSSSASCWGGRWR